MARKQQSRRIGGYPPCWEFKPEEGSERSVRLSLDEYECIRLIDGEDLTHEQCAEQMGVARTTVTAIYYSARKKMAEALVEGKTLRIGGGSYKLSTKLPEDLNEKGKRTMRIAISFENGEVFRHFGHTEQFKLYDTEDGRIVSEQIVASPASGHGALAGFLKAMHTDALICGNIGMGARNALSEAGVRLYAGVQGSADDAAKALLAGELVYDPDAACAHHGEHHHGEGGCGQHGEHHHGEHHHGEHNCGEGGCGHHE